MRARLSILGTCVAVAFAGCGAGPTIDAKKTAAVIRKNIVLLVAVKVKSVDCPSGQPAKKGSKFQCTVVGPDGSRAKVTVTGNDERGGINIDTQSDLLSTRESEASIAIALSRRVKGKVKVKCQEIVQRRKGGKFSCTATDPQGHDNKVAVTQTDTKGGVFYKVL